MREFDKDRSVLVIDIGNSNIVCGLYKQDSLQGSIRFGTHDQKSVVEYYESLRQLLAEAKSDLPECAIIGSVVPERTPVWQDVCKNLLGLDVYQLSAYSPLGISYMVPDPGFIGADLIANVFAAWKLYSCNSIIIDLGTATKIQLVTDAGLYAGVAIAPGLQISADTLFAKAAKLQDMELNPPATVLGNNTVDALNCGIVRGHALMIRGFIEDIKVAYPELLPLKTILTGGLSHLVMPLLPELDVTNPNLTLDGLYLAAGALASQ
jgi:type III pantothenate kinase